MILNGYADNKTCTAEQIELCKSAYKYVGTVLDTFTFDCVYVAVNSSIPKETCKQALDEMVSAGSIEQAEIMNDGTVRYRLVK